MICYLRDDQILEMSTIIFVVHPQMESAVTAARDGLRSEIMAE